MREERGNPILVSKICKHPQLGKPRRGLQILDTRMGFPRPSRYVVIDSINGRQLMIHLLAEVEEDTERLNMTAEERRKQKEQESKLKASERRRVEEEQRKEREERFRLADDQNKKLIEIKKQRIEEEGNALLAEKERIRREAETKARLHSMYLYSVYFLRRIQ